jgi:hypothetical protein
MKRRLAIRGQRVLSLGTLLVLLFSTGCFRTFSVTTVLVPENPEIALTYESLTLPKSERCRLHMTANRLCYLYLIRETPDGQVGLLLPGLASRAGHNRLSPGETFVFPGGEAWMAGGDQAGTDRLTLLVTDKASSEFDVLRYRQDLRREDILAVIERLQTQHVALQEPPTGKATAEGLRLSKPYSKAGNLFQYVIQIVRN